MHSKMILPEFGSARCRRPARWFGNALDRGHFELSGRIAAVVLRLDDPRTLGRALRVLLDELELAECERPRLGDEPPGAVVAWVIGELEQPLWQERLPGDKAEHVAACSV